MSVGGKVIQVIELDDRIWVNTYDGHDECAVYVHKTAEARRVEPGDSFWWQGRYVYWTPKAHVHGSGAYDIRIPRRSASGVSKPRTGVVKR